MGKFCAISVCFLIFSQIIACAKVPSRTDKCLADPSFLTAKSHLVDAKNLLERRQYIDSIDASKRGTEALGYRYLTEDDLDDTGLKISLADMAERNRDFAQSAKMRIGVLDGRTSQYTSLCRSPKWNYVKRLPQYR